MLNHELFLINSQHDAANYTHKLLEYSEMMANFCLDLSKRLREQIQRPDKDHNSVFLDSEYSYQMLSQLSQKMIKIINDIEYNRKLGMMLSLLQKEYNQKNI